MKRSPQQLHLNELGLKKCFSALVVDDIDSVLKQDKRILHVKAALFKVSESHYKRLYPVYRPKLHWKLKKLTNKCLIALTHNLAGAYPRMSCRRRTGWRQSHPQLSPWGRPSRWFGG